MAFGQSYDGPRAIEITIKDKGKIDQYKNTTNIHTICLIFDTEMKTSSYYCNMFVKMR